MKTKTIILGILLFCAALLPNRISASTLLTQSYIDKISILAASSSPYFISEDLFIPSGKEVVVEAGAELHFFGGQIRVSGDLKLQGSSSRYVLIKLFKPAVMNSAINIIDGNLQLQFVTVTNGTGIKDEGSGGMIGDSEDSRGTFIESMKGRVEIIHSRFENISSNKSFILVYGGSSLNIADANFLNIWAPTVIELYQASLGNIRQTFFDRSGNKSVISVFDRESSLEKSRVNLMEVIFQRSLSLAAEVSGGAILSLEKTKIFESIGTAILSYSKAVLEVKNSALERNEIGIESYSAPTTIVNSSIELNRSGGIVGYGDAIVAFNNWWGDKSGPYNALKNSIATGQSVVDAVSFTPWLTEKPGGAICCSNILFIPGIQGSRLYVKKWSENQLWEPNTNADVKKLYLDDQGNSIQTDVYTRDVIEKTNLTGGLFDMEVYEGFVDFMKGLVGKKIIASWKAFPYDWRLSTADVALKSISLEKGGITTLLATFDELVKSSKTGKVSIVAHSNGGLVAKNFVRYLIVSGKEYFIDQLILVAVPEYGTPQAIADMLHGDSQSILGGIILTKTTARNFAMNMPAAYGLLPTQKYFDNAYSPAISFNVDSDSALTPAQKYGYTITNREQLGRFLTASDGDRTAARTTDQLAVLNGGLLNKSEELHQAIDGLFVAGSTTSLLPESVFKISSIVGIGNETMTGLIYKHTKKGKNVNIERTRVISNNGDGVVLAGEPKIRSGDVYSIDLKSLSLSSKKNYQHSNILNASSTQQIISSLITNSLTRLPPFVSKQASTTNSWKRYEFTIHSPVSIVAYDGEGNKTGLIKEATEDDIGQIVEDIPGSQYVNFSEAKTVITATIPKKVLLEGLDTGTFTFTATEFEGDKVLKNIQYSDVPTVEGMVAEFLPASSSVMSIDYNSDGMIDQNLPPDLDSQSLDLDMSINFVKATISSGVQNEQVRKKYIRELDGIQRNFKNGDIVKINSELTRITDSLARAMKVYNFLQKKMKIRKLVEPAVQDTTILYYQFQKLSSLVTNLTIR